jgi:hypothetical protein
MNLGSYYLKIKSLEGFTLPYFFQKNYLAAGRCYVGAGG